MPLTRGDILGYDADRMSYKFTMLNGVATINCEISNVALGDLVGSRWKTSEILDKEAQFLKFREQIESVASNIFDTSLPKPSVVRIFAKHLRAGKN